MAGEWKSTGCILCSINCGLQVQTDGRHLTRIKGDRANPRSRGYTCEKPARLDLYQNHADRLTSPLRRRPDGTFEEVDWDTAIRGVAAGLAAIRDAHGGDKIMYYGGGGQGNHLGGAYSGATRRALGMRYQSNALAQEKTGEFWAERKMFGARPEPDFENAEVSLFIGKNPWHSHGFERARVILKDISRDPERSMIVMDPRRTETADLADFFLQVRPGTDAFCLSALLGVLVQEDLLDGKFLAERTGGGDAVIAALTDVPVADYCERSGVAEELVRAAARRIGRAESVAVIEDLGIEMAPHSTLNSYLEKLVYALTGNFGRPGTMNLGTHLAQLIGSSRTEPRTPVGGHRIITGLIPCNVIADEILTDHPDRFRAMFIESGNPVHSLADSPRMREALDALELVVVIDVAMTETTKHADWVLPAASQYEKREATFFGGGFPDNVFQLRQPLFEPLDGTLPEPEIHSRLTRALGAFSDEDLAELREAAAEGRSAFQAAFLRTLAERPDLAAITPVVLYETLGRALGPEDAAAALLWGAAHGCASAHPESVRRAGFEGEGPALGEVLFDAILTRPEGVVITSDTYDVSFDRIATDDGRIQLEIPELLEELAGLRDEVPVTDDAYPFVLAAGERRGNTANTIYRDPSWRKKDRDGALRISPEDAARLGVESGGRVRITTKRGSAETVVEVSDTLRAGHVTLPNGLGVEYPDENGERVAHGVAPNELTSSEDRDWLAGTPWHKHVRARVEAID
ncbi:MAG: molybdopterin-dependent oxidoreductase [Deltaproteobacteria bacterium]|nr:molybdopterin-dependent oxidoreductase [Deltaproteobacteria bacterium]MBW2415764.1 molybdopterin-dependent oxidoreductase [Deltaproteobacteria bacterium]